MTADQLCDYMLGRVRDAERRRVRRKLAADRKAAAALRRMRAAMSALRARFGRVERIPREWIELLERRAPPAALRPMRPRELRRERTKTWL